MVAFDYEIDNIYHCFRSQEEHGIIDSMRHNDDYQAADRAWMPRYIYPLHRATIERYLLAAG